jgi:hypothetical protein
VPLLPSCRWLLQESSSYYIPNLEYCPLSHVLLRHQGCSPTELL